MIPAAPAPPLFVYLPGDITATTHPGTYNLFKMLSRLQEAGIPYPAVATAAEAGAEGVDGMEGLQ